MTQVITLFKVPKVRAPRYLRWLKTLPCDICGSTNTVDPHHPKCTDQGGGSLKCDDDRCVPLCRWRCHDAGVPDGVHRTGNEAAWWARHGKDPIERGAYYAARGRALGYLPREGRIP